MDDLLPILEKAETLLTGVYQAQVHLDKLEQFESGHTVLRCSVHAHNSPVDTPATVIVKKRAFDRPADPNNFDQAVLFKNEWASLDFLTSLSRKAGLGPRLIASDRRAALVVLEDLGSTQSVQDVLYGTDPQAAVEALVGMARSLGRLQATTRGHEAEFSRKQTTLGTYTTICDANLDCRGSLAALHSCQIALGIDRDKGFDSAIDKLEEAIFGPSAFRSFIHNDAGPHNLVVTARGIQLLDFEFAGYGHGLIDIAGARLGFPPSFRGRTLAIQVAQQMEIGYREELTKPGRHDIDDRTFTEAVAQACAHWAFSKLIGFWNGYLQERLAEGESRDTRPGKDPKRSAFARQQVFTYLRLAQATLEESNQLPELRGALSRIVDRVLTIWPETPLLPPYPAFGGEPWHYP